MSTASPTSERPRGVTTTATASAARTMSNTANVCQALSVRLTSTWTPASLRMMAASAPYQGRSNATSRITPPARLGHRMALLTGTEERAGPGDGCSGQRHERAHRRRRIVGREDDLTSNQNDCEPPGAGGHDGDRTGPVERDEQPERGQNGEDHIAPVEAL